MKRSHLKTIAIALAITGLAGLLAGCGNSNPAPVPPPALGAAPGAVAGVAGCVPISQPIGFNATGIAYNFNTILAGMIQPGDPLTGTPQLLQIGQVQVMAGGTGGPYTSNYTGPMGVPISQDAVINMNIMPTAVGAAPGTPGTTVAPGTTSTTTMGYGGTYGTGYSSGTATGTISVTPQKQQQLVSYYSSMMYGGGLGYNPYTGYGTYGSTTLPAPQQTTAALCANGVGISLGLNGTRIYGGGIYLYISAAGAGNGDYLQF